MNGINETCPLIMRDLYYYDIVAAFPTIMKRQFYDFKDISLENKAERSKFVGIQQIDNPQLSSFLNESVKNLIDYYIRINEVRKEDIIFRQKDGIISNTKLVNNDKFVELKLRKILSLLIIDTKRMSMLYFDDDGNFSVKGVSHYYQSLDNIYKKIFDFDFYNIRILMKQMESLKQKVIYANDDNISLYAIEKEVERFGRGLIKEYTFMLKNNKSITVRDIGYINPKDIDTWKYFNHYFKIFFDSIYLEVTQK
jgi:hypothetical protein